MSPVFTLILLLGLMLSEGAPPSQGQKVKRNVAESSSLHLPRNVTPLHYQLQIQPLMEEGKFEGHVKIKVQCQEDTDKITLNAHRLLDIHDSKVQVVTVPSTIKVVATAAPPPTDPPTVAPVPVGAARLVPISSSFVPENACTSAGACPALPSATQDHHHHHSHHDAVNQAVDASSHHTQLEPSIIELKAENVSISKVERNHVKQWVIIHLERHMQRGEQYVLEIHFSGELIADPQNGIYVETYTDIATGERRAYVATQMQPENARKVFPCFDEPSYKAPMQITILATNQYTVLGNMPEESTDERGDWVGHKFLESPPMASFSVAFTIFNLNLLKFDVADDAQVTFYGRNELLELSNTLQAVQSAARAVEELKEYLQSPLPVPKLDFVVLPGSHSYAESNWGLVFLRESHLTCSHCLLQQLTRDVAYQWIGHLVTPHCWEGTDMNKALASFLAFNAELKIDNTTTTSSRMWFMNYPLYYEFGKRTQYTQTAFQKHPHRSISIELVLRMFNYTLSQQTFRNGLHHLLSIRSHKSYQIEDVWFVLTLVAESEDTLPEPGTANQIASSWLNMPRIPYVKITRDYDKFSAEVEQHSFYRDVTEDEPEVDDHIWWIPLVVVSQNNLKFDVLKPTLWMEEENRVVLQDLPSSSYFIVVNPEEVGPFIVNYDRKNWFLISEYLDRNINNEQIPAGTRGKLVHDALNLAFGGKLRFDSALNVTRFLIHERDPVVWLPAFNLFDHILRQLEGSKTAVKLQEYIKAILTPAYETLVNKTGPYTSAEERMLSSGRAALCATGYAPCVAEARRAWKIWMTSDDPDAGFPINLSHFCWVFKFGTSEEWEFGLERYKKYPPHVKQTDRYYLLKSLVSCPNNAANIDRLLNMTLLSSRDEDADNNVSFLLSSLSSDLGYKSLFNILDENWDQFKSRYDTKESRQWEYIISTATMNFKTQEGFEMVSELSQQRKGEFGKAGPIIEQALRQIKRHVKWAEDHGIIIDQWLDGYLSRRRS